MIHEIMSDEQEAIIIRELSDLYDKLKNANEPNLKSKIQVKIELYLNKINVNRRNKNKIEMFSEIVLNKDNEKKTHKQIKKYIESTSIYGLITALTQVGKTNATRDMMEICIRNNIPVIISSDNKTDQQIQLYNRIKNDLSGTDNILLIQVSDRNFSKSLQSCILENRPFIIFCLDNQSQIEKIISEISNCSGRSKFYNSLHKIKKLMIIHDEADVIQKDSDVLTINEDQAKSHQKWIELVNLFNETLHYIDLKRVFVTATFENCAALYNIECAHIIHLEIPNEYKGYNDITHFNLESDFDIRHLMISEVNRIQNDVTNISGEVILYCIERNTIKGDNNQTQILNNIKEYLPNTTIHTYTGKGMSIYTLNKILKKSLTHLKIKSSESDGIITISKQLTIKKFYTLCQDANERVVITLGKDLINRGISYVSDYKNYPLSATVMFYKPGDTMHNVGNNQTIGRITGCSRPDLGRKLYTPQSVYNDYVNYNKNQKDLLKKVEENGNMITTELWENNIFKNVLKKQLDRPKLKLHPVYEEAPPEYEENKIDGVDLKKLRKRLDNDSLTGRMIKFIYDCNREISFKEFKNGINYDKSDGKFRNNIDGGLGINCMSGKIWIVKNNYKNISMNPTIRNYIDSIKN